jgi:hypothetical protein
MFPISQRQRTEAEAEAESVAGQQFMCAQLLELGERSARDMVRFME